MKKTIKLLSILSLSMLLGSCDWINIIGGSSSETSSSAGDSFSDASSTSDPTSSTSEEPPISSSEEPPISSSSEVPPISSSSEEPPISSSSEEPPAPVRTKTKLAYGYDEYVENSIYALDTLPNEGAANFLIIPIWFNDSNLFITAEDGKDNVRNDIEKAFFGTKEETGWHSVRSFYEEESVGRCQVNGTVTDWYNCGKSVYEFGDSAATTKLVVEAVNWYFRNNTINDKPINYDGDADGYIDSVILIYGAPNYSDRLGDGSPNTASMGNMWAYTFWIQNEKAKNRVRPGANTFFWCSYDFMYSRNTAAARTGKRFGSGDNNNGVKLDTHTFIHETGHMFGLDDYYDYGPYGYDPAGQFTMQDMNVGGHDPYSVVALNWADPYIVEEPGDYVLKPFQSSHDVLLISPQWNENNSPFDEYLLVELYTPTGLNEMDATHAYSGRNQGPSRTGIRIWHVDARLVYTTENYEVGEKTLTTSIYDGVYGVYEAFSNTYGDADYGSILGEEYFDFNLLQFIRKSANTTYRPYGTMTNRDMFYSGESFSMYTYNKQFVNGNKLNNGESLGWGFAINIEGDGKDAVATISVYAE